ncbi:MAG: GNAT family N-acetyltransferase [Alphaproteobacteria bacterium]|nr:GNAT family N-acetyltransferase [Alphaproteobacteria bacterium]
MADKIKRMGLKDLSECAKMYTEIFTAPPWNEPWTERLAFRRLKHLYDRRGAVGFVFRHDKKVIGFLLGNWIPWLDGNAFVLKEICVDADEKYTGIGSELLDRLYAFLKVKNVNVVELVAMRGSNAFTFFEGKGFTPHERLVFMSKNHSSTEVLDDEKDLNGNYHCHDDNGNEGECACGSKKNKGGAEDSLDAYAEHKG